MTEHTIKPLHPIVEKMLHRALELHDLRHLDFDLECESPHVHPRNQQCSKIARWHVSQRCGGAPDFLACDGNAGYIRETWARGEICRDCKMPTRDCFSLEAI